MCYFIQCFLLFAFIAVPVSYANETIPHTALMEDLVQLETTLHEAHPIGDQISLLALKKSIPPEGLSRAHFQSLINSSLATLNDGHSHSYPNDVASDFSGIPLLFYTVDQALYVAAVTTENDRPLIGAKLLAVENIPLKILIDRVQHLYGSDNRYGAMAQLANFELFLAKKPILKELLPEWQKTDSIRVTLERADGQRIDQRFTAAPIDNLKLIRADNSIAIPYQESLDYAWGPITADNKITYLRVGGMINNRETFEKRAASNDVNEDITAFFKATSGDSNKVPDPQRQLQQLPAISDSYKDMLKTMKAEQIPTLIIDLRTNVGGWALTADMLIYYIYGRDALINLYRRSNIIRRKISRLYLQSEGLPIDPTTLGHMDTHMEDRLIHHQRPLKEVITERDADYALSPTFYADYKEGKNAALYQPKNIYVLVNGSTYSAGFMFAQYLSLMGAITVGMVPGQNIEHFGEIASFTLKNSKLPITLSTAEIDLDSFKKTRGTDHPHMILDIPLHYNDLKRYSFQRHAPLLSLLDKINP